MKRFGERLTRIRRVVREAVSGSERDFTSEPLGVALFLLAVPMVLEMVMESIFALVDIYFVGHLGAVAIAAVGLTETMMAIIYAFAMGLGIGATALVSRRVGEGDPDGAGRYAAHAIYCAAALSLLISVVGIAFAPQFLKLLGASPEVLREGTPFTRLMLGSNAVIVFLFVLNAIFRGAGDAAIAMRVLIVANALNIVLAPLLIYGPDIFARFHWNAPDWVVASWPFPKMGLLGAAVGTTIGRGVGALIAARTLWSGRGRIAIVRSHWKFSMQRVRQFLEVSVPAIFQIAISTASWGVLVSVVAKFGNEAIAGYVIGLRILMVVLLPAVGIGNATATLVGQSLGAGNPQRAEEAVWFAAKINGVLLGVIGLLVLIFRQPMVAPFAEELSRAGHIFAVESLRIVAYGFAFYGVGMVLENAFNGAGDTLTPTYLNIAVFWLFEIPLAWVLAHKFGMGLNGVCWAITIAFVVMTIASGVMFRRGAWKRRQV